MRTRFEKPVLLIGGGPVERSQYEEVARFATSVVAADGGAEVAARYDLTLSAVIGDLDSVSPAVLASYSGCLLRNSDQNTTDFEKCLAVIEAPLLIGIGFLAGRLDHELAAMNALARYSTQKVVLLGARDVVFRCPARLELALPQNTRLSVFPMGPVKGLRSEGLDYTLDGLEMAPDGVIGTSNRTNRDKQVIEAAEGALLVIVPRRHLPKVVAAL